MSQYFEIGKIAAVHGIKGEVVLVHELGKKTSLKGIKALFVQEKKDVFFPWFVEEAKAKSETEIYVKFDDIKTPESAKRLVKKAIWMKEEDFQKFAGKGSSLSLLGYTLFDKKKKLSEITEVIDQGHQLLCKIIIDEKEILIPLHTDFISHLNEKKKEVYMDLPDGLLEIYLD